MLPLGGEMLFKYNMGSIGNVSLKSDRTVYFSKRQDKVMLDQSCPEIFCLFFRLSICLVFHYSSYNLF